MAKSIVPVFDRRNFAKLFERRRIIIVGFVSIILTLVLLITFQTHAISSIRQRIGVDNHSGSNDNEKEPEKVFPKPPPYLEIDASTTPHVDEKVAYVTFLSGTVDQDEDLEADNYLQAVRILVWQLKHNPETRTNHDVVVMVTPSVGEKRRARLARDGAIIYPVDFLHVENDDWIKAEQHRWDDVITKMRVWEMTQYNRIMMLDGDMMLRKSLDGIFDDPGAQILKTKPDSRGNYTVWKTNKPFPETYLLASLTEVWDSSHAFPPGPTTGLKEIGYMNAGFFMLHPSIPAFEYYKSLMETPNSFDPKYPEQNLMNFAHRWGGPMPWREVAYSWNTRCPNENDFEKGLVSMHEKWWTQPYIYENKKVKEWLVSRRWEMKGWYDAWDLKEDLKEAEKAKQEAQMKPQEKTPTIDQELKKEKKPEEKTQEQAETEFENKDENK